MKYKISILLSAILVGLSMGLFWYHGFAGEALSRAVSGPEQGQTHAPAPTAIAKTAVALDWSLLLVNADNPLPEDYSFFPALYDTETVDSRMLADLTALLQAARAEGCSLWIASGFRDRETQEVILQNAVKNRQRDYGYTWEEAMADALLTIAQPGYSEHETGLVVDFNTVSADFAETEEYAWLTEHAAEYGFIERYAQEKEALTGIDAEPWHYRYVGQTHARALVEQNLCLEEYCQYLSGV